ncbi:MAG: precorrin-8X methylmutase [Chloroflexales bacterium]|nr:precorrin-8X methylmutase [Chloroflexales bacterium]
MTNSPTTAAAIAAASFTIIRTELAERGLQLAPPLAAVVERVIHSTADFEFATLLQASPGALEAGVAALRRGCPVLTDVQMVRAGISERRVQALGGALHCLIDEASAPGAANPAGITRSAAGIRAAHARGLLDGAVVAVGNAPTALYELLRCADAGARPALTIGVPVGFVNTVESKAALVARDDLSWIVATGRKGGSTVAVAIVNALLRLAAGADNAEVDP